MSQQGLGFFHFLSAIHLISTFREIFPVGIHQLLVIVDDKNPVCHVGVQARRAPKLRNPKTIDNTRCLMREPKCRSNNESLFLKNKQGQASSTKGTTRSDYHRDLWAPF